MRKLLRPTYVKRSRKKNNNNGINHPHIAHIYALPTPFTCAHPQSTPPTHNFLVCFAIAPVAYTFFTIFFRFVFLFAFLIHLYGHISLFSFILTFPIMHLSWRHARCGPLKTARASGGSRMPWLFPGNGMLYYCDPAAEIALSEWQLYQTSLAWLCDRGKECEKASIDGVPSIRMIVPWTLSWFIQVKEWNGFYL